MYINIKYYIYIYNSFIKKNIYIIKLYLPHSVKSLFHALGYRVHGVQCTRYMGYNVPGTWGTMYPVHPDRIYYIIYDVVYYTYRYICIVINHAYAYICYNPAMMVVIFHEHLNISPETIIAVEYLISR